MKYLDSDLDKYSGNTNVFTRTSTEEIKLVEEVYDEMTDLSDPFIVDFYFTGFEDYPAEIDDENEVITINLPNTADISSLVANFTTSDESYVVLGEEVVESGVGSIDYSSPITFACLNKNGYTDYLVKATISE